MRPLVVAGLEPGVEGVVARGGVLLGVLRLRPGPGPEPAAAAAAAPRRRLGQVDHHLLQHVDEQAVADP